MRNKDEPLVIERTVDAPVTSIWKALTDITLLRKWQPYFEEFIPEVGFQTRFEMGPDPKKQYEHICEVTEVIENRRLTYSWRYEGYTGDSYVTFDLAPLGDKTKITLTHRIIEPFSSDNLDFSPNNFTAGWTRIMTNLIHFTEEQK